MIRLGYANPHSHKYSAAESQEDAYRYSACENYSGAHYLISLSVMHFGQSNKLRPGLP